MRAHLPLFANLNKYSPLKGNETPFSAQPFLHTRISCAPKSIQQCILILMKLCHGNKSRDPLEVTHYFNQTSRPTLMRQEYRKTLQSIVFNRVHWFRVPLALIARFPPNNANPIEPPINQYALLFSNARSPLLLTFRLPDPASSLGACKGMLL